MKRLLLLSLLCSGCSAYTAAKIELVNQVRRGVAITRQATTARQQLIERFNQAQLDRLDDAFDNDLRKQAVLNTNWVIEHRKAYALARDVLNDQKHQQRLDQAKIESNLDLIDRALGQLQLMHEVESRFALPEVIR